MAFLGSQSRIGQASQQGPSGWKCLNRDIVVDFNIGLFPWTAAPEQTELPERIAVSIAQVWAAAACRTSPVDFLLFVGLRTLFFADRTLFVNCWTWGGFSRTLNLTLMICVCCMGLR